MGEGACCRSWKDIAQQKDRDGEERDSKQDLLVSYERREGLPFKVVVR